MHQFLKSIGFHEYHTRANEQELFELICSEPDATHLLYDEEKECQIAYYSKEVAPGVGIMVYGEFDYDEEGEIFYPVYYYPYVENVHVSGKNVCEIFRRNAFEDYIANCDDYRFGVTLIFHVVNQAQLREELTKRSENQKQAENKRRNENEKRYRKQNQKFIELRYALTALAESGKILMPVMKTKAQVEEAKEESRKRSRLIERAKNENEEAITALMVNEMQMYTKMKDLIYQSDLYTLIDTYFMPNGVECDMYSLMGDIIELNKIQNQITKEWIYSMLIECNEVVMRVTINEKDLLGEPEVGRRFKGVVWMQAYVSPENDEK